MKKLLPFLFFIVIATQSARSQYCASFTDYTAGATIMSVDTADFNGDTFLDIVTTSHGPSNSVNIFLGDGTGNFTAGPVITGFPAPPRYVASGDIDGDGDPDLMVAHNNTNMYSRVVNTGGGTFGAPAGVIASAGSHIMLNAGDLDNDGDIDFAYAQNSAGVVLRNNGSGTFTEVSVGKSYDGYGIAVGDVNNDTKPDLITIAYTDSVGVLINNSSTPGVVSFLPTVQYYTGQSNFLNLRYVTCRDLNNDGFGDVIASHRNSSSVSVFMGNAGGTLGTPTVYPVGGQAYNTEVADFNQDGNADFVVTSSSPGLFKVFFGDGTGAFPGSKVFSTAAGFAGIRVVDFNGDTRPDLATAGSSANTMMSIWLGQPLPAAPTGILPAPYCSGDAASPLSATGTNLLWYTLPIGGSGSVTMTPSTASAGTFNYYVSQNPTGTCESPRDTVSVLVNPGMTSTLSNNNVCINTAFLVPFAASGGTPPISYSWNPSAGASFITNNPDTMIYITSPLSFTVTATDVNGCSTINTTNITTLANTDLYGVISSSSFGVIDPANVYAFQYLPNNSGFDTVAIVATNAAGQYTFTALAAGDYLVKAIADTAAYPTTVPTYYGDEFQWDSSIVVTHGCTQIDTADIQVIELAGGTGLGYISGYVYEGPGYGLRLMNPQLDPFMVPGGPLKGIDVKLGKNPSAGIQARTMTDTAGFYHFDSIPDGDYKVYVDIPNLPMDSLREVTLSAGNDTSMNNNYFADSVHIYIDPAFIIGMANAKDAGVIAVRAFPNPASHAIHISVTVDKAGWFQAELTDITGKKVMATLQQQMQEGETTFSVNLSGIAKGVYTLNAYINNARSTLKVVIID
jgi:hypothetical protein